MNWGTPKEIETRRRIKLCVWAYAYERQFHSIVSDSAFDHECLQVDLSIKTDRPDLDAWFLKNFDPSTGAWVHAHPELNKIAAAYFRHYVFIGS